jgi:hypothetical protein
MRVFNSAFRAGYGVVGRDVSGRLYAWDLDCADTFAAFVAGVEACRPGAVVARLRAGYEDQTPSDGRRWLVRVHRGLTAGAVRVGPWFDEMARQVHTPKAPGAIVWRWPCLSGAQLRRITPPAQTPSVERARVMECFIPRHPAGAEVRCGDGENEIASLLPRLAAIGSRFVAAIGDTKTAVRFVRMHVVAVKPPCIAAAIARVHLIR